MHGLIWCRDFCVPTLLSFSSLLHLRARYANNLSHPLQHEPKGQLASSEPQHQHGYHSVILPLGCGAAKDQSTRQAGAGLLVTSLACELTITRLLDGLVFIVQVRDTVSTWFESIPLAITKSNRVKAQWKLYEKLPVPYLAAWMSTLMSLCPRPWPADR